MISVYISIVLFCLQWLFKSHISIKVDLNCFFDYVAHYIEDFRADYIADYICELK